MIIDWHYWLWGLTSFEAMILRLPIFFKVYEDELGLFLVHYAQVPFDVS